MRTGIIGLPGSGKSTLFDLLTEGAARQDPSHTGNKPRVRSVRVHDARLDRLRDDFRPKKYTPAALEVLDFPAVRDATDRAGVADILAPAREADALLIVLRDFSNPSVPGGDRVDPLAEFDGVRAELILSDLVIVEKRLDKLAEKSRKPAFGDEEKRELSLLTQLKERLEKEETGLPAEWSDEDRKRLCGFAFLSTKPRVVVVNAEVGTIPEETVRRLCEATGSEVLVVAAQSEREILELPEAEREPFLREYGIREFMRDHLVRALYRAAARVSFFTVGEKEVRAWTIRDGETAVQAAGAIHSDIERGFIRAEVVSYADYDRYGGMKGAKEAGHYRLEGRDYLVREADIILFRFSV